MEDTEEKDTDRQTCETTKVKVKTKKELEPGIIYLSRIPTFMNVKKVRQVFGQYGELGRIFLQPDDKAPAHKKNRTFTEGWVEFLDKKIAKQVARSLNNMQVGGKRRSPWYDELWNIKYLPKFKWGHLNERLAYEKAAYQQRLRTEVSQAKRETTHYIENVERHKVIERLEKKRKGSAKDTREWNFKQRETEDEIVARKKSRLQMEQSQHRKKHNKKPAESTKKAGLNKSFLKTLFSGGLVADQDTQ